MSRELGESSLGSIHCPREESEGGPKGGIESAILTYMRVNGSATQRVKQIYPLLQPMTSFSSGSSIHE